MNKTININLGGIFFHIDESAYQKLKDYLSAIRRSLSDDPNGRDEIINDIETRIGELLSEKIKDVRQVINESDIDEVVEIMGKPEDYMVDDEIFNDDGYSQRTHRKSKKLYRDGDDKFLGGVSSGIAHYLELDVIWIRLAWLVAAFGFGFGFILYPILWILLPQANTTAEKLEMEGEQVNISNIEKKIKEEIASASARVKNGFDEVSQKVKSADYKKYQQKAKSGSQDMVETLGRIFNTIFMVIGKLVGVLLIVFSIVAILGLLISLFTLGSLDFFNEGWLYQNSNIYNSSGLPIWAASALVFVLAVIPFFFLFMLGLRVLSKNVKTLGKSANLSLLGIWLVALLMLIYFGTRQFMQSAFHNVVTENHEIMPVTMDTLNIKLIDNEKLSANGMLKYRWESSTILDENKEEKIYSNHIRLNILPSDNDQVYLKIEKSSKGKSKSDARDNATAIMYDYKLSENDLLLNGYFLTEIENKFKDQTILVHLYLPENQVVYLDKSTRSFLSDVENTQDIYDRDMAKHYFKMTEDGFNCLDCENMKEENEERNPESVNMKINEKGVHIEIVDEDRQKAEVKLNKNGLTIESSKDSI
jgi:phage shock protein PspC (stress-responsive transcriptional regulator)